MIQIELDNLDDLREICECLEYCLRDDKIHPDNREQVKKIAEKLRNDYENYQDLEREKDFN